MGISDFNSLAQVLQSLGPTGIIVAFFVWWTIRSDKLREAERKQMMEEKRLDDERRFTIERDRISAQNELASSLGALTSTIQSMRH